jgi:hypothetical protein
LIAAGLVLSAALAEGFLAMMVRSSFMWRLFPTTSKGSYFRFLSIIQDDPVCSRYDPELRVTLKPGVVCRFSNQEFDTVVRANALGLRDSDEALRAPDIIVLGDSFAMGWGVDDRKTFAKLLERRSGLRVLNAGMSGYDTVSEMLMLKRLDTSRLKYLIIQYCINDYPPNRDFYRSNSYYVETEADHEREVAAYLDSRRYHPGQYLSSLWKYRKRKWEKTGPSLLDDPPAEHVKYFINALLRVQHADLSRVQLIVLAFPDSGFTSELKKEAAAGPYPAWIRRLSTVDTSAILGPGAFFRLDDHITADGHAEIAGALMSAIGK